MKTADIDLLIQALPGAITSTIGDMRDDILAAATDALETANEHKKGEAKITIPISLSAVFDGATTPDWEIRATVTQKHVVAMRIDTEPTAELEPNFGKGKKR